MKLLLQRKNMMGSKSNKNQIMELLYPYTTAAQQNSAQPYPFVEHRGQDFLKAYYHIRIAALEQLENCTPLSELNINPFSVEPLLKEISTGQPIETSVLLEIVSSCLHQNDFGHRQEWQQQMQYFFSKLRHKAEIRKLPYSFCGPQLKRTNSDQANLYSHCLLAYALSKDYTQSQNLQSLSTLLKTNDYIIAELGNLPSLERSLVKFSLHQELSAVYSLRQKLKSIPLTERLEPEKCSPATEIKTLPNLGLIFLDSIRSRAYIQKLLYSGFKPNYALIIDNKKNESSLEKSVDAAYFHSGESIYTTFNQAGIPFEVIPAPNFNDQTVIDALSRREEEYFVFSGTGILKEILTVGKKLIHVHPGRIPEFKGSTTFIYSLLAEGRCAASSFLMNSGIDTGDLIASREFLPPSAEIDLSRTYDPYIRSLVLAEVIQLII